MIENVKKIAVMTSGGDAPGMNAAVRGVVRAALNKGWQAYGIRDAYRGLVAGGENIFPLDWVDVSWSFREGGTFLGSARYPDIMETGAQAAMLKETALLNLKRLGISGLVVIGGDGSLTGADELFSYLRFNKHRNPELENLDLAVVGIPGSIDNDIACTDMSIGVDTTLNTIVECIDKLRDTATSHKRVSIVEVMGRLRGYLAVMSGLATGADWTFIREKKTSQDDLNQMLQVLQQSFANGQKAGIVVRSEGAVFSTGFLKETVAVLLHPTRDVRETVLGHLQRGGTPTTFERALATRMGVRAVLLLEEHPPEPYIIGLTENHITATPLSKCLATIKDPAFKEELSTNTKNAFELSRKLEAPPAVNCNGSRIAVITDGNNVSGMNMAIRAIARLGINGGIAVKGIKGGFAGLMQGTESIFDLEWGMLEMKGILRRAGTLLGVSSNGHISDGKDFLTIRKQVEKVKLDGIVAIGSNMAYASAHRLSQITELPIVGIPADTNCNLPGTSWVIGMDSALNDLLKWIDRAADAAQVQKKIFILHLKGEYCRCLVHLAALAGGADQLIFDDRKSAADDPSIFQNVARKNIAHLKRTIGLGKKFATIIYYSRNPANAESGRAFIDELIDHDGISLEKVFIPLETSYGGSVPTAFDRILAERLGEKALNTLQAMIANKDSTFQIVGINGKGIVANPYREQIEGFYLECPPEFVAELHHCMELMDRPDSACVGIGGDIEWIDTRQEESWKGQWSCKKCGQPQTFYFNPQKPHCLRCPQEGCYNYGFIRISRHF